jgi:hypothetical protein
MKFFRFIDIYLERVLLDKMKESLSKYLKFILQFMARQASFSINQEFVNLGLDEIEYKSRESPLTIIEVRLVKKKVPSDTKKMLIEPKESVKIPREKLSSKNTERPEPVKSVYEVVTVPDI